MGCGVDFVLYSPRKAKSVGCGGHFVLYSPRKSENVGCGGHFVLYSPRKFENVGCGVDIVLYSPRKKEKRGLNEEKYQKDLELKEKVDTGKILNNIKKNVILCRLKKRFKWSIIDD